RLRGRRRPGGAAPPARAPCRPRPCPCPRSPARRGRRGRRGRGRSRPLAALTSLAGQPGEGRPWALRALGVARASAEGYADARAAADTLAAAYAGSEHARFGLGLAVRVAGA